MKKLVGLVLINYQDYARRYLTACRQSLQQQDYPTELIKIYIIDNAATTASAADLARLYPEAKVLSRSDGNYAAANNLGAQAAWTDGCEYLVSVNMDTEMATNWLSELIKGLESSTVVGIAQSKILLYPQEGLVNTQGINGEKQSVLRINTLGNIIHFLGFGYTSAYGQADRDIANYPCLTGYASGCSLAIKKKVFQHIGGYNEEFYMYHDDLEISLKARLAGYHIVLAPQSVIYHKYQFSRSVKMVYYMERNRYLTLAIFYPWWLLIVIAIPGLLMDLGLLFFSLVNGWFKDEMKVYRYFLDWHNYVKIGKERRKIKKLAVVPFVKIAQNFSGRIDFQEITNPLLKYIINPLFSLYWLLIKKFI